MLWASSQFPLARLNDPVQFYVWGIVAVLTVIGLRRPLAALAMDWRRKAPLFFWAALIACGITSGAVGVSSLLIANGLLDRGAQLEVPLVVVGKSRYRGDFGIHVTPADSYHVDRWRIGLLLVSEADYERLARGSTVTAILGHGFLGVPWRRGYRIPPRPIPPDP